MYMYLCVYTKTTNKSIGKCNEINNFCAEKSRKKKIVQN